MAVIKEKLRVVIPGLTNRDNKNYYTETSVYKANLNIQTFQKSINGFLIEDFWNTDLFNVTGSNIIRRRLVNELNIERNQVLFYVSKEDDTSCPFVVGEYYWIYNEVVLLTYINDLIDGKYELHCSRAQFGTTNKIYKMNQFGDLEDGEEVYISNYKNDFNGLRVELYDLSDNLINVGTIKETTYTDGIMVIDCDDYLDSLDVDIPEYKIEVDEEEGEVDVPFYVDKMLISFFGFWRDEFVGRDDISQNYNFYQNESDLFLYIDYDEFRLFINYQYGHFKSLLTRDSSISDYIRLLEFLTSKYIVFSGGRYRFLNLFNYFSTFEYNNQLESRNIHNDLSNIKYTTTRLFAPTKIEFEFNNRSLNIISNDKASIGSGDISFKIGSDLEEEYIEEVNTILDSASLNYFRILDFAICELKIQTPASMNKNKYIVGETFIIYDIDKFFTFERGFSKDFNVGIVIKNEGNDISILVTRRIFFDPFVPCFNPSSFYFSENLPNYILTLLIDKKQVLPFTIDEVNDLSLTHRPPYIDRQYFAVGDSVKIYTRIRNDYLINNQYFEATVYELPIGDLSNGISYLKLNVSSSVRYSIINEDREIINVTYPNIGNEEDFQSNFCKLDGSSLWV